ncbi:SixA phosphatase family protein [Leifsonia sp. AG29]|uniref:SixA phosphatase family protein n=1 Tax=Leifsonia sp. AG29 TaxID=2598860 RepID=UPI00131EBB46|nr:histidine phosphatase family protein [Leifsonia sp. AG29]
MTEISRTLILLRHAKSDWSSSVRDIERPLADRGRTQAPLAGRWLGRHAGPIDLAVISPAQRARETWELVSARLSPAPPTRFDDRVYAASAEHLLDVLHEVPDDARTVLVVGHNPGMEQLASMLAGENVTMRTSGIAEFHVKGSWAELGEASAALRAAGRFDGRHLR